MSKSRPSRTPTAVWRQAMRLYGIAARYGEPIEVTIRGRTVRDRDLSRSVKPWRSV